MAARSDHTLRHEDASSRTEDGKVFILLVFVLVWLALMATLPIWLPALVAALGA